MQFINRLVYFKNNKCVGAGFSEAEGEADRVEVMSLPTDHYDFLGAAKLVGKTKEEIETEVKNYETAESNSK